MEYKITLDKMEFRAYHGCYDLEQMVGNQICVDIELTTELGDIAEQDDLSNAVSYLEIYEIVEKTMKITCKTLERATLNVIDAIYDRYPQITNLKVRTSKIAPPLGGKIKAASVELSK